MAQVNSAAESAILDKIDVSKVDRTSLRKPTNLSMRIEVFEGVFVVHQAAKSASRHHQTRYMAYWRFGGDVKIYFYNRLLTSHADVLEAAADLGVDIFDQLVVASPEMKQQVEMLNFDPLATEPVQDANNVPIWDYATQRRLNALLNLDRPITPTLGKVNPAGAAVPPPLGPGDPVDIIIDCIFLGPVINADTGTTGPADKTGAIAILNNTNVPINFICGPAPCVGVTCPNCSTCVRGGCSVPDPCCNSGDPCCGITCPSCFFCFDGECVRTDPCCGNTAPCCTSSDPCCGDPCCGDPCCADPCCHSTNPCCGSLDPCCGSQNPCCGNVDPCCGSTDPCCGSTDPCCGNADPCCTSSDPCCGSTDPCCGSLDPCCGSQNPCCGNADPCCDNPNPCCDNNNPCDPICGDPCLCVNCDDMNSCTVDFCSLGKCFHVVTSGTCADDGNECTDDICMAGTCKHPNKADCVNCGANGQNKCINGSCTPRTCNITPDPIVGCPGSMVTVPVTGTCSPASCDGVVSISSASLPTGWSITGTGICATGIGTGTLTVTIPPDTTLGPHSLPVTVNLDGQVCQSTSINVTVEGSATLTLTPSRISATSPWTGMPNGVNVSDITVQWNPPDCVGRLEIVELVGTDGYNPPDQGMLMKESDTLWHYTAFNEPVTQKCPKDVTVWIGALIGDLELTRKSVLVPTVHEYFTQGSTRDFTKDFNYISWKYATVLATTGGTFAGPPTISTSTLVPCGLLGTLVTACTHANDTVDFGTSVFTQSENATVSTIGHELAHTVGMFNQSECTAYTWEMDHAQQTWIFQCDTQYLGCVVQNQNCACNGCP